MLNTRLIQLFAGTCQLCCAFALCCATSANSTPVSSEYALAVDEDSDQVLLDKNSKISVPIASLTKLMTAMVVLDSKPNMQEIVRIDQCDVDTLKHSTSHVPVGTALPRQQMLQLALMSSDNRAAAALARSFPGGKLELMKAVRAKIALLGMTQTTIEEPTGLSPKNISTASDLVKMAEAAARYPEIASITTKSNDSANMNGLLVPYRNTNKLVGKKGWEILLSKTGYTSEAGRCLIMRFKSNHRNVVLVLLNAKARSARTLDALTVRGIVNRNATGSDAAM